MNNRVSNKIKKEMDIYKDMFQSYLIGQLGKADGTPKGMGPELIKIALGKFFQSFETLGCRTVRLDCKEALVPFYEQNGFFSVSREKDEDDLYHMVFMF